VFILYLILILCTVAVVGVAFAIYRLVRRHMRHAHPEAHVNVPRLGPVPVRPRGPQLVRAANVRPGEQKG
jgi:hypothetical protein